MGATADKLNKLNQTKTAIKEALETPYNVFADYSALIKKYVNNQPTSKVSNGVCKNSLNVPLVSLDVDGNCEQNSYEGYNKFNYEDFVENVSSTVVSGEAKSFKLSTNSGTYNFKDLKENTSYCVSGRATSNIVNGSLSLVYSDGSSTTIFEQYDNASIDKTFKINSNASKTLTTLKITIYGNTSITINDFMVYEGTEEKPYEPYVGVQPSPNPEYPQYIEVIDGVNLLSDIGWERKTAQNETQITDSTTRIMSNYIKIEEIEDYYISIQNSDYCFTNIILYDENKNQFGTYYNIVSQTIYGAQNLKINFPNNTKYARFTIRNVDNTSEVTLEELPIIKPMLIKGAIPKPYLPYGYIGLEQSGKNLFDKDNYKEFIGGIWSNKLWANKNDYSVYIEAKVNTSYTVSRISGARFVVGFVDELPTSGNTSIYHSKGSAVPSTYTKITVTNTSHKYLVVYYYTAIVSEDVQSILDSLQIEEGSIATDYEPYHEPVIHPINLNGNSIAKVGDVKDLLKVYRNGNVEIEKKIGKVVLDGSSDEHWIKSSSTNNMILQNLSPVSIKNQKVICSHFISSKCVFIGGNSNQIIFKEDAPFENTTIGNLTLTQWLSWLSIHNTEIHYPLAELQIIKLPAIDPIQLWEGTNNFKLITNLDTTFEMEYVVKI